MASGYGRLFRRHLMGHLDGLRLPVTVCAYFPSLIQKLVVESWLNIPACYQVLPTGK